MRLNSHLRGALLKAILSKLDFSELDKLYERLTNEVKDAYISELPKALQAFYRNPDTFHHFKKDSFWGGCFNGSIAVPMLAGTNSKRAQDNATKVVAKYEPRIIALKKEQAEIRDRISATLAGIQTIKQLRTRFPEWADLLPAGVETAASTAYPVVDASLLTDLMRMGYPDGKRKPVKIKPTPPAAVIALGAAA